MMNQDPAEPKKLKIKEIPTSDTLENWEAADPVIPLGMLICVKNAIGFETHFKIGLGNRKFSETPYIATTNTLNSEYVAPVVDRGDTGEDA